jgi:hypothetical protein
MAGSDNLNSRIMLMDQQQFMAALWGCVIENLTKTYKNK